MDNPNVSVVLAVFNGERYLADSISSVIAQEYKDYEFIIWDDGSTDKSGIIIDKYKDPRIKLFRNKNNLGLFTTLNLAISKAKGRLIRLWSQDDIMKSFCLSEEVKFHNLHPEIGFSYCAVDYIDSLGRIIMEAPYDRTPEIVSSHLAAQIMTYYSSLAGNIASVMIKKEVLLDVGLFRQDMKVAGDFEMWVRITEKYPVGFIHKPLIYLRSHKEQFSRKRGVGTVFRKETEEIYDSLFKRLPLELVVYAKKYVQWYNRIYYFHYGIHSLLIGDFKTFIEVYKEIIKRKEFLLSFFSWLITLNAKFFRKKPKFII